MCSRFALLVVSLLLLVFLPARGDAAASPRDAMVVSTTWLAAHAGDPGLILLHVGDKAEYAARHLPGARFVAQSDLAVSDAGDGGRTLEMPAADDLRRRLEALGISDASRIVVYFAGEWASPATRVVFTLDYAGLGARTALLDGGLDAWTRDGHAVTAALPKDARGALAPLHVRPIVVDADEVRRSLGKPGIAVVDGRAASLYAGVDRGGSKEHPHRVGHIDGALSVPYTALIDDGMMLRPREELAALFANAGVKRGDTIIGYCHVGQQATLMLFAARTLGFEVRLYDGSFEDWSRHADYPVKDPRATRRP